MNWDMRRPKIVKNFEKLRQNLRISFFNFFNCKAIRNAENIRIFDTKISQIKVFRYLKNNRPAFLQMKDAKARECMEIAIGFKKKLRYGLIINVLARFTKQLYYKIL